MSDTHSKSARLHVDRFALLCVCVCVLGKLDSWALDNWVLDIRAPDSWAPTPSSPGPNCPPPKSELLGPGLNCPWPNCGAQLSEAQLANAGASVTQQITICSLNNSTSVCVCAFVCVFALVCVLACVCVCNSASLCFCNCTVASVSHQIAV